jgi:drug/metabolite transporter (DMT)-like permease
VPDASSTLATGAALGLGAAFVWGFNNVLIALVGRRLGNVRTLGAWQASTVAAVLVVGVLTGFGLPGGATSIPLVAVAGLAGGVAYLFLFTALRLGPISIVSPVIAANGGLTVVLASVVLGERLHPGQILGVMLATIGVLVTGIRFQRDLRRSRFVSAGVVAAVGALVAFAVMNVASAAPSRELGWAPALVWTRLIASTFVMTAILVPRSRAVLSSGPGATFRSLSRRESLAIPIGGALSIFGFVLMMVGLERSATWIVGLTSSFAPVVVVVVGLVLFGERLSRTQMVGIVLVMAALPLIAT